MDHDDLITHYHNIKPTAENRLNDFTTKPDDNHTLFKELTFCVFAANSSAEMGIKAVNLLEPVLHTGDEQTYKDRVHGKVRFYNVRSEYTAHNHDVITRLDQPLNEAINHHDNPRQLVEDMFKGIGWKEASHFLRNTGHTGYCILDKHIRRHCADLNILEDAERPTTHAEYTAKEQRIHRFCDKHELNVDILDLALWSYTTGEILK